MFKQQLTPPQLLAISFISVILIGSLLLYTPWSVQNGQAHYMTALFTAASATCVTGLTLVDTATYWTSFGQVVIILLAQIGGLGVMSFATFFALLFGWKIHFRQRLIMQQALNQSAVGGIVKIFRYLLIISFAIETIAAIILTIHWMPLLGFKKALWFGIFHSISAFNNAGFDLFANSISLNSFTTDVTVNLVITTLIIIGGLGFVVLHEIFHYKNKTSLSLHTRVVLITTAILIIVGTIILLLSEYSHALRELPLGGKLLASYFQTVSGRTAGFTTIDINSLFTSSQLVILVLMFIGGSPGSTSGGIKTSTLALLWIAIISQLRGKKDNEIFRRRIPDSDMLHAFVITIIYGFTLIFLTFLVFLFHQGNATAILFEVVSALGTVGLSLGFTNEMTIPSQIIIIIAMILGRVGPLTIGFALAHKRKQPEIHYPKGKILIG
ncbi:MAG: TrkH family potassium uptake protein [Syntrophomonas sp.]|nr:TrkH family potassium uptake protein [Syntrophomonas sp.]